VTRFGAVIPTRGPLATRDGLLAIVKRAEMLGFDFVSVPDHIVIPRRIASQYPYSESGAYPGEKDERDQCLEQLTALTFLAGVTSRLGLLTSVMVVPYRSPMHTAKVLASIDVLSRGRLIVGCGAGWMREEFEAVGAPPYERRGAVTDEYLRAFKELWTAESPSFKGAFCRFSRIAFEPKPVQKPTPPIWIGGESPAALRRAGRFADAWYPIGSNPEYPVATPKQLRTSLARVRRHAEEAGRDPSGVGVAYATGWYNEREAEKDPAGKRRMFTGSAKQIAGDFKAFATEGVEHFAFNLLSKSLDETLARMERFANEVRPLVEAA
jgi:probable F420-dependent oxidoreductase